MSEKVIPKDIIDVQEENILRYSLSVIMGRAISSVYDGLKLVHRRILDSCRTHGHRSSKPFVKCAKIVGSTMGELHPHGM